MDEITKLAIQHERERIECEKVLMKLSEYVDQKELEDMNDWSLTDLQDRLISELEDTIKRVIENSHKFSEKRLERTQKLLAKHGVKEPVFTVNSYEL